MRLFRLFLLMSLMGCNYLCQAQAQLLYTSQDFLRYQEQKIAGVADTLDPITSVESRGVLSKYLIIRHAHSKRQLVDRNSLWGFVDVNGRVWRSFEKELFLVTDYNGSWVEYLVERPVKWQLRAKYGMKVFSRTPDSHIRSVWSEAMADVPPGYIVR